MSATDPSVRLMNFKSIHVGSFIRRRVLEVEIDMGRICNFLKCTETEVYRMYEKESLDCEALLRWSKLLSYDFFRIYSQHLIYYSPPAKVSQESNTKKSALPVFRKNLYTQEIIDFVLEQLSTGAMTKKQVVDHYGIPKSTLHKWIYKHPKNPADDAEL